MEYKIIRGSRGSGKTMKLIQMAADNNAAIVSMNVSYVEDMVRRFDLSDKVKVLSFEKALKPMYCQGRKLLIDDAEEFMQYVVKGHMIGYSIDGMAESVAKEHAESDAQKEYRKIMEL